MTIDTLEVPKNPYEAFKSALILHITAPTIEDSNEALYLAESFSENLTEEEISTSCLALSISSSVRFSENDSAK